LGENPQENFLSLKTEGGGGAKCHTIKKGETGFTPDWGWGGASVTAVPFTEFKGGSQVRLASKKITRGLAEEEKAV